ncbi:hypothetical protein E8E13_008293 [Curvularia kusanoi]|uniref:Aminoglycoside phosphotransferase domain-containing protein n=1 Tax=Curvularia kusanoi TaxID=90978 RepID=A0A9P4TKQ1_CURKU|nr:hypothetical protein E8E13_008293 [Curvularia kusanoi]
MFPPAQGLRLDIDAISQIFGSISIACWIVVFSPQIIENWRRSSAEGLSVVFIIIWLLGDFFNIFGAVLQGVLPTMTILAVYYTLADIVLLGQCFWYKGFTLRDTVSKPSSSASSTASSASEEEPLLSSGRRQSNGASYASVVANGHTNGTSTPPRISDADHRRGSAHSQSSFRERFLSIDGTHLSPATPLHGDANGEVRPAPRPAPTSTAQTVLFNLGTILLVMAAGVFGWWLSAIQTPSDDSPSTPDTDSAPEFNLWGQIFGYICAALYLGSRIPQLLLNYRRKSTDGISMLFFLFACLGNLTYRIVARLPFALAGPARLTTHSEVATIKYLQKHTTIPIPKILAWSDDPSNPIGSEYIVMEHASGVSLHQRWSTMDLSERLHCIRQDFTEYYNGLIDSGLARLPPPGTVVPRPRYQGSIEQHKQLLNYAHTTLKELAKTSPIHATGTPTLFHPDLHKRNIFVSASDPTTITAIIDWQSTSTEPAFKYTNTIPDFAELIPNPSNEAEFEQESELCAEAYDVCLRAFAPTIPAARHTDDSYFRPFWEYHAQMSNPSVDIRIGGLWLQNQEMGANVIDDTVRFATQVLTFSIIYYIRFHESFQFTWPYP